VAGLGSNLDSVRRRNLASVLTLIHHSGAISRARLTAQTGLNRSTIAGLVGELAELDLVVERTPEATNRVGRPSPQVMPHGTPAVLAVNPEVDAVTVALVGFGGRVERRVRRECDGVPTPEAAVGAVTEIVEEMSTVLADRRLYGAGLAVPGLVRSGDGVVRWAPHLGWVEAPIAGMLERELGVPVLAGNDASLGAIAEHLYGAGRGIRHLVYLNGGASGIGGGMIVDGRPLGGAGGYAGEFGQNSVAGPPEHRRTDDGTLEDEVNRARLLDAAGIPGADETELDRALLTSLDPAVAAELARQRSILGTALAGIVNALNPELVVLGGFLATVLASDPVRLERIVAERAVPAAYEGVRMLPAALGPDRLLIGAAELALSRLLSDPVQAVSAHPRAASRRGRPGRAG